MLVDSGAGGGNYASAKLIHEIEQAEYNGRNMISKRGKGRLRAATPVDSKEPPMTILGTCILFLVFPPVDGMFAMRVRVVEQLPIGLIMGTAFMRRYGSSLHFEGPGPGWFKPTQTSPRAPLLPWMERPRETAQFMEAEDATEDIHEDSGDIAMTLDDQEWILSLDDNQSSTPSEVMAMEALELGTTAWQDEGTLKWDLTIDRNVHVPGGVSVEMEARVTGPIPDSKTLVVVSPVVSFDLEEKATLGVAKGVQWWIPGTHPKIKLVNKAQSPSKLKKRTVVATASAVNCDDVERMVLLKEPLPEQPLEEPMEETSTISVKTNRPDPQPGEGANPEEEKDSSADFTKAKIGQLGPQSREKVIELLRECKAFYPRDVSVVTPIKGKEVALPLRDENVKPVACKARRFSPHMDDLLMAQINPMLEGGILSFSNSQWCSGIVPVVRPDGGIRTF